MVQNSGMIVLFRLAVVLALALWLPTGKAVAGTDAEDARAVAARTILADYQAGAPRNHRVLHVAYFCPADRTPAAGYEERLGRVLGDISAYYAAQLRHYGLPSEGIPLARDEQGRLVIHLVKGARPAAEYSEAASADEIRRDVRKVLTAAGIGLQTNHVVVFTRLGNYDGTNTSHNSPYCGMGNSQSGFCWQFDSDILDTRRLQTTNQWVNDRQYGHITLGRYNSIFIGGTAHELGHLFGLPHNAETAPELKARGHALMGDGNRHYGEELRGDGKGSFITLAHALRLASNPLFSQVDKGLGERWRWTADCRFDTNTAGHLKISGRFTSSQPVYGVVAYVDPNGGSDYDAVSYAGALGPDSTFTFELDSLPRAKKTGELRLCLLCASGQHLGNGRASQVRYPYTIGADGQMAVDTGESRTGASTSSR
jgi:hypothetical protein